MCIQCQSSRGKTFQLQMEDYEEVLSRVCNDVNKTDRPKTTPTVRAISTLPYIFRSFDLFVTSLLFMKGISYCVIRRKLEPLDRAKANFYFRGHRSAVPSLSLTPLSIIYHLLVYCFGSFLLQDLFLCLQVFAFKGQNITFTVNVLLTRILYSASPARLWLELFASTVG